jgi:hypothetical protein
MRLIELMEDRDIRRNMPAREIYDLFRNDKSVSEVNFFFGGEHAWQIKRTGPWRVFIDLTRQPAKTYTAQYWSKPEGFEKMVPRIYGQAKNESKNVRVEVSRAAEQVGMVGKIRKRDGNPRDDRLVHARVADVNELVLSLMRKGARGVRHDVRRVKLEQVRPDNAWARDDIRKLGLDPNVARVAGAAISVGKLTVEAAVLYDSRTGEHVAEINKAALVDEGTVHIYSYFRPGQLYPLSAIPDRVKYIVIRFGKGAVRPAENI